MLVLWFLGNVYNVFSWLITFLFVSIACVFFQAENLDSPLNPLKGAFGIVIVQFPAKAHRFPELLQTIYGKNNTVIYIISFYIMSIY